MKDLIYICDKCGYIGEEKHCPRCANIEELDVAEKCDVCGKYYPEYEVNGVYTRKVLHLVCDRCHQEIMNEFINVLHEHYDSDENRDLKQEVIYDTLNHTFLF